MIIRGLTILGLCAAILACGSRPSAPIYDRSANPYRKAAVSESRISRPSWYVVRRGDTLYAIAWRYGLDFRTLARWNGIGEPYLIQPDQRLRLTRPRELPTVVTHPVPDRRPVAQPVEQPVERRDRQPTEPTARAVKRPEPKPSPPVATTQPRPKPTTSTTVGSGGSPSWQWPANGPILRTFSATDSSRKGLDIAGDAGDPVRAAGGGEVVYSGSGLVGYGELIIIKHDERFLSAYGHNRKRLVEEGDRVEAGQQIAEMGETGAQRPMLHFEIREDGEPVDPQAFLPRR